MKSTTVQVAGVDQDSLCNREETIRKTDGPERWQTAHLFLNCDEAAKGSE
jgi:hypothetical protein